MQVEKECADLRDSLNAVCNVLFVCAFRLSEIGFSQVSIPPCPFSVATSVPFISLVPDLGRLRIGKAGPGGADGADGADHSEVVYLAPEFTSGTVNSTGVQMHWEVSISVQFTEYLPGWKAERDMFIYFECS